MSCKQRPKKKIPLSCCCRAVSSSSPAGMAAGNNGDELRGCFQSIDCLGAAVHSMEFELGRLVNAAAGASVPTDWSRARPGQESRARCSRLGTPRSLEGRTCCLEEGRWVRLFSHCTITITFLFLAMPICQVTRASSCLPLRLAGWQCKCTL